MPETRHFDDILKVIGEFGCWQKFLYFTSCCLVIVPSGMQLATIVFATGTPNFHCVTANVTCEENKCCDNCTDYSFDGPFTSTVSEWNLICSRAHVGAVVQAIFVGGMMAGSLVFGIISDMFGRKFCLFLCSFLTMAFSLGSSFVDCLSFFTFLRFCAGAAVTGLFVGHYVYILELVGPNYRTLAGKVQDVFWVISASIVSLAAYLIRDWRYLIMFASFPPGLLFVIWRVFPESVRWLVTQGKLKRAQDILMTYAEKNSANVDRETISGMLDECRKTEIEGVVRYSPLDLVRTSRLRKRTLILCFNWMNLSLVFYGILLYVTRLAGNMYLNVFLMFLTDLLHTPLTWIVIKQFGRRVPHFVFMLISGLSCLLVLAVPSDQKRVVTALAFIGRFFASASFSNIYLYSSELYPTVIRNLALGTCSTSSRIGGIIAPFIVMLAQLPGVTVTLPLVILGVLSLIAGFMSLWLPETLFSNMHQTIEEVERATENYGIVCMGKPRPCPIPFLRCDSPESREEEPWTKYPLTRMNTEDGEHSGNQLEDPLNEISKLDPIEEEHNSE